MLRRTHLSLIILVTGCCLAFTLPSRWNQIQFLECDQPQVVLEFSPDGNYLATCSPVEIRYHSTRGPRPSANSPCTRIQVWDIECKKCILTVNREHSGIQHLGFTPSGKYLAESVDYDGNSQTVTQHDLKRGTTKVIFQRPAKDGGVISTVPFKLSPDHGILFVHENSRSGLPRPLMLCSTETGEQLITYPHVLTDAFWISPDGKYLRMPLFDPKKEVQQYVIRSFDFAGKESTFQPQIASEIQKRLMSFWHGSKWTSSFDERFLVYNDRDYACIVDRKKEVTDGYMTPVRASQYDSFAFTPDSKHLFLYGQRRIESDNDVLALDVYTLPALTKIRRQVLNRTKNTISRGTLVGPWFIEMRHIVDNVMKNDESELFIVYDAITGIEQTRFYRNMRAGHHLVNGPILGIPGRSKDWISYYYYEPGAAFFVMRNVVTGEIERMAVDGTCTDNIAFSKDGSLVAVPVKVKDTGSGKQPSPKIAIKRLNRQ